MVAMVVPSLVLSNTFMIISSPTKLVQHIKLMAGIVVLHAPRRSNAETAIHKANAGLKKTLESMV